MLELAHRALLGLVGLGIAIYLAAVGMYAQVHARESWWPYAWLWFLAAGMAGACIFSIVTRFELNKKSTSSSLPVEKGMSTEPPTVSPAHSSRFGEDILESAASAEALIVLTDGGLLHAFLDEAHRLRGGLPWKSLQVVFRTPVEIADRDAFAKLNDAHAADRRAVASSLIRDDIAAVSNVFSAQETLPTTGLLLSGADGADVIYLCAVNADSQDWLSAQFVEVPATMVPIIRASFHVSLGRANLRAERVVLGTPRLDHFVATACVPRGEVLRDTANTDRWVAALIAVTIQQQADGSKYPLLQVNTPRTSTREISKLSHISGYLNEIDVIGAQGSLGAVSTEAWEAGTRRELLALGIGGGDHKSIRMFARERFYYATRDDLYMSVLTCDLNSDAILSPNSLLAPWPVASLMDIRTRQVLEQVLSVLDGQPVDPHSCDYLADLLVINLRLQECRMTRKVLRRAIGGDRRSNEEVRLEVARQLSRLGRDRRVQRFAGYELDGLAGLQFREFFRTLLPIYREAGVQPAADLLQKLDATLVAELHGLYNDKSSMKELPFDI